MRIVAGQFKGRRIGSPKGEATRPTADRVREALFSSLCSLAGPDLGGGATLDLFAGSGALGFEALSRGSRSVTFVERDRSALTALRANADALGALDRVLIVPGDASALAVRGVVAGGPFSLLLLDPPYRLDAGQVGGLVAALGDRELLEDGALVVYEHERGVHAVWPQGFGAISIRRYGSTEIDIAKYGKGTGSS